LTNLWIFTRYLLIVLPAIGSMFLESYASYGTFTFFTLLFLWIAQFSRIIRNQRFHPIVLLLEIGLGTWLSFTYQGVLFIFLYSTLMSYWVLGRNGVRYVFLFLQFGLLHLSLLGRSPLVIVTADLLFVSFALLLLQLRYSAQSKMDVETLYDSLRRKHYELDEARVRLIEYAQQVEDIALVEERNRISRDIHDDLGHKLIRLKMMMEAAIQILPNQPEKGMQMIHGVRNQLGESMELLRATVRKMKPDDEAIQSYSLDKLITDLAQEKGIQVHFHSNGLPYSLYPSLEFILYRNAQEAITNAIRHGSAAEVYIGLTFESKRIRMEISNNGIVSNLEAPRGIGISGMEERTKLVGGQLVILCGPPFTVTTILPTTYRNTISV
jgi:two-component system NarL family sensor kinase